MSAATRARRLDEQAEIIVFERGAHVPFANCGLPYFIGGTIADRSNLLVQTPERLRERFNIDVRIRSEVTAIDREKKQVTVRDWGAERTYSESYDSLVLAPGAQCVRPTTELARDAGLKMGETGGIWVDDHLRTSDPDIYAVGDAVEVTDCVLNRPALIPLAGSANRQGRIAANNIFGRDSTFRGVQGTAIVKVFDLTAACTGPNEKKLRELGIAHQKVYVHPGSHAGYYPGAATMALKLIFSVPDGRVLGAQIVGRQGVDKRIDVLATAIQAGMTVYDLEEAELAYAPPYGSAKDAINMAGFVAANYLRGDVDLIHADELDDARAVLDVRTPAEFQAGHIPDSILIPLDELRGRLDEVPRDGRVAVCCAVGLRAYVACRILQQNGFDVANIPGGFTTYCHYHPESGFECPGAKSQEEMEEAFWADVE